MLKTLFDRLAELGNQLCQPAICGRDEGFELCPNQARQHWRGAAGRDRGNYRRAIDDGRHNKSAKRRLVHDVDRDSTGLGSLVNRAVDRFVVGGGNDENTVIEQRWLEGRFLMLDLPFPNQPGQDSPEIRGIDDYFGASLEQQSDLSRSNLSATNEGAGATFKV